ncbi:alpha-D-ribose 1-methylphosphonate 5-triphosphate diphosphatase [Nitratireductor aquimarinus]|uniref:alpha-D-ribose 1-methylphosphonate 5-triphosphate diphosphatase n=1 Tax=Alphaproteobacteria TaxID=28211 RepID=UPI0019D32286|nr:MULTISPECIES: alpha-D-ribose 1-methylphosphonate 5-triphosphate diphosphatase [Alphaproteobacteria]MBN7758372.1 alpha-D-ribose 1-methylphosphonate 5-triphosphate diphosphatase [Nitratireductor aquimarinus]MBY6001134.1 alpha-D-ribose 1-methylphosphonate 5-triphosphate diphosphatase [Tritonibacter mobilis]MBY6023165.1 alpha-D-ribose 1-methylphosphonate 5-triphosphate diphosphatase [Nitratireductor sp. DP7N14-4]
MTQELVLRNARIVLPDEVIEGSVVIRDGRIVDIAAGNASIGEDMEGDYLLPGLVELHTDHLERHYAPRPKVRWNPIASVLAHDAQIAASGITTVFDALRIGLDEDSNLGADEMRELGNAIENSVEAGRLRADHFLHLRCEVSAPDCLEGFELFKNDNRVKLASLMDHSPGQRQFTSIDTYKVYYMNKTGMTEEDFREFCEKRVAQSQTYSSRHRNAISDICREQGIILASHDDATMEHVDEAATQGVRVAEFPTTQEAATASRDAGMQVLMGAPNVVRGGSHSGNVSARSLAEGNTLDILSSDYIPFSLVQAAFALGETVDHISLPQAVAMVSKNPAEAVGLDDRGILEQGRRGDVIRVRVDEHVPIVRSVWREGARVA